MAVERPDQVWCADVTYIPMRRVFLYLVAIIDWFSRKVLGWRLSTTRDADFCVAALDEAIACHGKPNILNTDQGSQFTSFALTTTLKDTGIRISGTDAALDGQHLHRAAVTQPQIRMRLPQAFETGSEARSGIGSWIDYCNRDARTRPSAAGRPTRSMLWRK